MFDSFAGTIGLVVVALLEMISVVYVYGHEKFTKDIQEMTGVKPGLYWQISWRYLAPGIMVVILVSSIISMSINHPSYAAWSAEKVRLRYVQCCIHFNTCDMIKIPVPCNLHSIDRF